MNPIELDLYDGVDTVRAMAGPPVGGVVGIAFAEDGSEKIHPSKYKFITIDTARTLVKRLQSHIKQHESMASQ